MHFLNYLLFKYNVVKYTTVAASGGGLCGGGRPQQAVELAKRVGVSESALCERQVRV